MLVIDCIVSTPLDIICPDKDESRLLYTENVPTSCVGVAKDCESTRVAEISVSKSVVASSSSTAALELIMMDGTSSSVEDTNVGIELETGTIESGTDVTASIRVESGTDVTAPIRVGSGRTASVSVGTSVASTERVGNNCVED